MMSPMPVLILLLLGGLFFPAPSPPAPRAATAPAPPVRDGAGRMIPVPARPARLVSLAPSVTEILFSLGAGPRVVGVTDFCSYPPEAAGRTRIGGMINPDLERIVHLRPDLVVATTAGNYPDDVERIERLGIPVYTIATPTLESVMTTLASVGAILGEQERAGRLVADLRSRIERVRTGAAGRPRVPALFVIEPDPLIVPGRATFIGEALAVAGADLVTTGQAASWAQYDMEQVIGMRPEAILTPEANRAWSESLGGREDWLRVPAVAGGRVYVISDSIQRPGPRIVDGIEEVAAILAGSGEKRGGGTRNGAPDRPLPAAHRVAD